MTEKLTDEVVTFFIKFVLIPLIAVGVKLSVVKLRGGKITSVNAVLSFFVGVAVPVILNDPIEAYIADKWMFGCIAGVAILSDKIAETVIYKVKIDLLIISIINNFLTPKNKE